MSSPSFPVLRLPSKALRATLQNFAITDVLIFSLLSPNSVRLLNIRDADVTVNLNDTQTIFVRAAGTSSTFFLKPYSNPNRIFQSQWRWLSQSLEKTLNNFLVALNLLKVETLLVLGEHAKCDNLTGIKFESVVMIAKNRPMFDLFYRDGDNISLLNRALLGEQTRAIFSENMNSLVLVPSFVVDFNDLLAINATKVDIGRPFTLFNLNLFLKHFINGSNPSLKELPVSLKGKNLEDYKITLLNGIKYWTFYFFEEDDDDLIDGLEFRRIDGVKVIIFVDPIRHSFELTC